MQAAITDANIFIDLFDVDLLEDFFRLPYKVHTTQFVLDELSEECCLIVEEHCSISQVGSNDKTEIDSLEWSSGFSFPDKTILYIAKRDGMIVFSGEKKMMKWCSTNNLESHGVLFVLQQFIDAEIRSPKDVARKLLNLLSLNQWLPTETSMTLIEKWNNISS